MPSTIPYDPSLTLTSVVGPSAFSHVEEISKLQGRVDTAQESVQALITSKRSLEMTKTELKNLGVSTDALDAELAKLNATISKAVTEYASTKQSAEPQIQKLQQGIRSSGANVESPVDNFKTELKTMPLAADSINMDVQYFNFDSESQNSETFTGQIAAYISTSTASVFGSTQASKMAAAASADIDRQLASHKIQGTLVLAATCTHKNATVLAPFVLHVDKAIKVWNSVFPGSKLDPTSRSAMLKLAMSENQEDKQKFSIVSGTTFGSSFVALLHILESTDKSSAGDALTAAASTFQSTLDSTSWAAPSGGKFGIDANFSTNLRDLFNQHNIISQVTLLSTGLDPSPTPTPDKVPISIDTLDRSVFQSNTHLTRGPASQNITVSQSASVDAMVTALQDHLKKASEGASGVPINYYLKDIDQKMLAEMWVSKYFPGQFMAIKDDVEEGSRDPGRP